MQWWPWLYPKLIGNWPNDRSLLGRRGALFNRPSTPLRPMVVLVDARLLVQARSDSKVKYLLELLAVPPIQAHLYAESGPPRYALPVMTPDMQVRGAKDWVITIADDNGKMDAIYLKDGMPTRVRTQATDRTFLHVSAPGPSAVGSSDAHREQVRADANALLVAKAIRADLFITDHDVLVDATSDFWRGTTVMQPHEALPIVGLYLRQQDRYILHASPALGMPAAPPNVTHRDRALFYWQAARELVSARANWEFACKSSRGVTGNEDLPSFPRALSWRLNQLLRARDRLLTILALVPNDHSPADDAVTELDQILLWFMAMFDITAQAAHLTLGLSTRLRTAAWQSCEWLKKVATKDKALADLVRNNSEGEQVLTIVRELRNTLHGEALSSGGMIPVVGEHALEPLVALPKSGRDQVLRAIDALGGNDQWGVVKPFPEADFHLHPGTFVEQLLPRACAALGALMDATAAAYVQRSGIDPARLPGPVPQTLQDRRILWQLGLESVLGSSLERN